MSLEVERQLKMQRKQEKEQIKQGKVVQQVQDIRLENLGGAKSQSKQESYGNPESINIEMEHLAHQENMPYSIPDDPQEQNVTNGSPPSMFDNKGMDETYKSSKQGFDATGGTSGMDIDAMMQHVQQEDDDFDDQYEDD